MALPSECRRNVTPSHLPPPQFTATSMAIAPLSWITGASLLAPLLLHLSPTSGQIDPFKTQVRSCCFNASISLGVKAKVLPIATGSVGYPSLSPHSCVAGMRASSTFLPPQGLRDCSLTWAILFPLIATWLLPGSSRSFSQCVLLSGTPP